MDGYPNGEFPSVQNALTKNSDLYSFVLLQGELGLPGPPGVDGEKVSGIQLYTMKHYVVAGSGVAERSFHWPWISAAFNLSRQRKQSVFCGISLFICFPLISFSFAETPSAYKKLFASKMVDLNGLFYK